MTPAWFVTSIWSLGNSAAANLPQQSVARVGPVAPKAFSVGAAYLVPTSQCGVTFIVPMTARGPTCVMRACKLFCDHPVWPSTPVPEGCWMEALIQSRSAKLLRLFFWLATQGHSAD